MRQILQKGAKMYNKCLKNITKINPRWNICEHANDMEKTILNIIKKRKIDYIGLQNIDGHSTFAIGYLTALQDIEDNIIDKIIDAKINNTMEGYDG